MTAPAAGAAFPPVAPDVVADIVGALPPRLAKRLDAAAAKLAARPVVHSGADGVRIAVDDEGAELTLTVSDGQIRSADTVVCTCLLAPQCVHRAAAVSLAPLAEAAEAAGDPTPQTADDTPAAPSAPDPASLTALRDAAWAVLDGGITGSGAVVQAALLRAAHTARLAGLHRASEAAVAVAAGLRAARDSSPAHRLGDLTDTVVDLLTACLVPQPGTPQSARQAYEPLGALRLFGLFTEPVVTARGYAGAVTYTVDADGVVRTVGDVAPGNADRALGVADRAVRLGDTTLSHRELGRAGLSLSGATASATGRLGAGSSVRAVRAGGVTWDDEPLVRLWRDPVATQIDRALRALDRPAAHRPAGADLLFLDVRVSGGAGTGVTVTTTDGVDVLLVAAHDDPALAYRDNLRLLASVPGLALRVVARLDAGAPVPTARALAAGHVAEGPTPTLTPAYAGRIDLGLDRLVRADLPATTSAQVTQVTEPIDGIPAPSAALARQVMRALAGGRRAVAAGAADSVTAAARMRTGGMRTGAELLEGLHDAAADRGRDVFGRLTPVDAERFARAWLAAAVYARTCANSLTAHAWTARSGA